MADKALRSDRGRALAPVLSEGMAHHRAGRLQAAAAAYERARDIDPDHPEPRHLLGLVWYRSGDFDRAIGLLSEAVTLDEKNATYRFNLGVVLQRAGRYDQAVEAYRAAVSLAPAHVDAWNNLGNTYRSLGRIPEAVEAYERALAHKPDSVDAQNNLGVVYKEQGRLDRALAAYDRALALSPTHAETHWNKGLVLQEQGAWTEARAAFEAAIGLRPDYAKAHHSLGQVALWQEEPSLGLPAFRKAAALLHDHGRPLAPQRIHRARAKHDLEQLRYLMARGVLGGEQQAYLEALESLHDRFEREPAETRYLQPDEAQFRALAPSFNRIVHYADAAAIPDGALNPALDVGAIEQRYHATKPEIMYVDDLLAQEALSSLRRFCLESTIWKREYDNGYLGTFLGEGFASPLLLQISEELRRRFPRVFKDHRLNQAWAFKYDSALTGLNIHADAAAVNVNFWITPDEANLDPESGGLVVWDKEAPRDWNFRDYNSALNRGRILDFLEAEGARAVTIPYRANRAVIFNSDLFHETGTLRFREGYAHRRINVTLLYGYRSRDH